MATQAHCAYCFECLSSSLENRPTLTLGQVEALWKKYCTTPTTTIQTNGPISRLETLDTARDSSSSATGSPSIQSTGSTLTSGVRQASSTTSKSGSGSGSTSISQSQKAEHKTVEEHPLFVTWNIVSRSGEKRLRGCIGTFAAQELEEGLMSYTLTSAFEDTRFSPITVRELAHLEVAVTLLTDFEPAPSPLDWAIGTHGLRISFTHHGRRYGSTYLPDVASEQGWTKEETLVSLMRKAGWKGREEDWDKVELDVVRYQGKKMALDYPEWKDWKDWVEEEMADGKHFV